MFDSNISDTSIQGSPSHVFVKDGTGRTGVSSMWNQTGCSAHRFKCSKSEKTPPRSDTLGDFFFFFPPSVEHQVSLAGFPLVLSLVSRQDDRLLAQWSNVLLTTWLWRSQVWSVWGQNRQLRQFSKSLHPGGSLARSSFPITLGRRQIPYEISRHRRWSQSNFVGVCENPWTCKGSFWLKKKMVVLLLAPDCCFNWTDDRTGFNKDETAFRWIPFNA